MGWKNKISNLKICKSKEKDAEAEKQEVERGYWSSPAEFILSCLGYAVGLGNIWRFPYMTFTNGGGAFLIPYLIMYLVVGLPTFFIELIIGQYSGGGPATVWEVSPLFKGVGVGMLIMSFIGSIYYNMIIAWALYYLFATFQSVLPWQGCDNYFNTAYCYSTREAEPCTAENGTWFNQTCYNTTYLEIFDTESTWCHNETYCLNITSNPIREWLKNESARIVSPSDEFFNYKMLERSSGMDETGKTKWDLVLVLLLAWVICFLCVVKGIKSTGKVVYFTATFPYVLLLILFFRAVLLPNARNGVNFYIKPQWEYLKKPKVWADAAGQIFFSLSIGGGGLMTFASYNKFTNNIYRDTFIVTISDSLTSFWAGFIIFSILGFIAAELGKEVKDVATSGAGLAFVAYPDIVTRLPVPQLWAFLFFFMLLTLGLDSQFATIENVQTALTDSYPFLRRHKAWVSFSLCTVMFLLGLTQCTQAGLYWTELMGYYAGGWASIVMGLIETLVFAWVYGADNLIKDVEEMLGYKLGKHWWFVWKFITPVVLAVILVMNLAAFSPLMVGSYTIPPWAQALGLIITLLSLAVIPLVAVIVVILSYKDDAYKGLSLPRRIWQLTKPTEKWRENAKKHKLSMENTENQNTSEQLGIEPPAQENEIKHIGHDNIAFEKPESEIQTSEI